MTIEMSTQAYLTFLNGASDIANSTADSEANEKDERFAQYLMAIKGAKLSETQMQKLGESRADDDRTRMIEKLDRKAKADDDHYNKMRSNGYTVGETRRGLDQTDHAIDRKATDAQRDAAHEKSTQIAKSLQSENRNAFASGTTSISENTALHGKVVADSFANTGTLPGVFDANVMTNVHTDVLQGQTMPETAANVAPSDAAQNQQNINTENSVNNAGQIANVKQADRIAGQSAQQLTAKAGKTLAPSMAGIMSMMTPVAKNANIKSDTETDAKAAATIGQSDETKESLQNTLTQEALKAASETQQNANDMGQERPQAELMLQNANQTSRGDVAVSQTLPNTSLLERVDQAKLTHRVASAFRSLANQSGTIRMKLHPEALGALTIRMQIESGKVAAKLEAETESAKQVLTENIDTLKRKLKEQNLEVTSFEIEVVSDKSKQTNRTTQQNTATPNVALSRKNTDENHFDHVDYYS